MGSVNPVRCQVRIVSGLGFGQKENNKLTRVIFVLRVVNRVTQYSNRNIL
ncbi:hypothetical protein FTUN_4908 [Frigoriglobus tundricola]|uniref:Uncharacterized protein n=1 Tax=Frigoriglobus tundricola TaxID=2774151 RepID=A0A6M5YTJ1_9BACT|nr:hypothetical protein FTUN_4908 [Frigoriglobus tundricola]